MRVWRLQDSVLYVRLNIYQCARSRSYERPAAGLIRTILVTSEHPVAPIIAALQTRDLGRFIDPTPKCIGYPREAEPQYPPDRPGRNSGGFPFHLFILAMFSSSMSPIAEQLAASSE
jgi:hypothetical protein